MIEYAGLGPVDTPMHVERVMRGIARVFAPSKAVRITGCLGGDMSFEDGARIKRGSVILYKPSICEGWPLQKAVELDGALTAEDEPFQRRAAACVAAVLGLQGGQPAECVILWRDAAKTRPQQWAVLAAEASGIPVHDLSCKDVLRTWADWVKQHATK